MKIQNDDMYDLVSEVLRETKTYLLTDEDKNTLEDYHYIFEPLKEKAEESIKDIVTLIHNYRNAQLGKKVIDVMMPPKQNQKGINEDLEILKKHAIFLCKHMGYSKEATELRKMLQNLITDTTDYAYKKPKISASKSALTAYIQNLELTNYSTDTQSFIKRIK